MHTQPASAAPDATVLDWHSPPDTFLDVGHSRLAYRRVGQGPDVVFVHGWPVASSTFRGVVERLRGDYTCHLFDLPGAGHTECRDLSKIELGEHSRTVEAALEQMDLQRYALVAHDSGGLVARHVAARAGDRVRALIMGNTEIPGHHPWQLGMYLLGARVPGVLTLTTRSLGVRWIRHSNAAFGACFSDPATLEGEFYELCLRPMLEEPARREGTMQLIRNAKRDSFRGMRRAHRAITAPTQLIWGADDPFFPLAKARGMREQFGGGAELVEISPGKLFVHEERPDAFADAALEFLARHHG